MTVKVKNICYDITEEDVIDLIDNDAEFHLRCEEIEDKVSEKIEEIESTLPKSLTVKVKHLEDVADAISDETGWLVKSFEIV